MRRALRAVSVDWGLLRRRRDLRLMIGGYTVSLLGGEFTQVALAVQVFALTHSSLAVGLLGAAEFIPVIALALVGGAMADAFDRRKLIWGAEFAAAFVSAALLVNALLPDPQLWVLYVAAALFSAAGAVLRPPLDALMPRLVERDELKAAGAMNWSLSSLAQIAGPAFAGVLIAATSVGVAYAIDVGELRRVPDGVRAHAHAATAARRGAAVAEGRHRGPALRLVAPGAARLLRDRHERDVLRHRRSRCSRRSPSATAGRRSSACCSPRPPSAAVVAMLTSGWAARVHHNGRAIVLARPRLGRRRRALRARPYALGRAALPRRGGRR